MNLFDNLPQRIFSVTEKATRDKLAKADESALNDVVPKELLKHTPDPFLEQLPTVFRKSIDA